MSAIWESGPAKQADRFVLLAIADYANDDGEAWPSIAGICRKTCMSERGVQGVIRRLEADGWLSVEVGNGRKNCNLYTVKNPAQVGLGVVQRSPRIEIDRLRIINRDNHTCQYCGFVGVAYGQDEGDGLDVDHIVPLKLGGGDDDSNLITSCSKCNQSKKNKDWNSWLSFMSERSENFAFWFAKTPHLLPPHLLPPQMDAETPQMDAINPAPPAPEPSRTIIKPSVYNEAQEIARVLCQWASPDAVASFIAYRKKQKGKALSLTAARRLSGHLEKIFQQGGDTDDALGMAEEKGWQSVEPSWYFKAKDQRNGNGINNHNGSGPSGSGGGMVAAFAAVAARATAKRQ